MSAADRDYWRDPEPAGPRLTFDLPPVTRALFFTLIGCFIAQSLNDVWGSPGVVFNLALTSEGVHHGWAWQLLTFQFLHGGILHLCFNLLGLWFLGGPVERILGRGRFIGAYLGAGIVGGLLQALLMGAFPEHYGRVVVGASAGITGLFAIFALLHPDTNFLVMLVLPVRALTLYYLTAAMAGFFTLVPSGMGAGVAHPAHLGGLLFGTLWVRQGWHHAFQPLPGENLFSRGLGFFRRTTKRKPATTSSKSSSSSWPSEGVKNTPLKPSGSADYIASEVDPILDKIAQHGLHSLTERERQTLDAARRKMTGK